MKTFITILCVGILFGKSHAQSQDQTSEIKYISKKYGHYTAEEWRTVIDSTWGEGLPTENKLKIFDIYWNEIDKEYPGFHNLDINWSSLRDTYRPEVEAGVSRGRFVAIMDKLNMALMDRHTSITDIVVSRDSLKPGVPIFVPTGYQSIHNKDLYNIGHAHFGASLTPLEDSSLIIYDVVENHPLGLEMGDIILGYEGIPWKDLYKELLDADLPIWGDRNFGTNEYSITHCLLTSAGENWHLFDTIDVIKQNSGDTLHLETSVLQNTEMKLYSTGQMPVNGVPFPDVDNDQWVSSGIVDGTNIGYIYAWNWRTSATNIAFRKAIETLINTHNVTGLILDSRYNFGGGVNFRDGLAILFNQHQDNFNGYERSDANDHFAYKQFTRWPDTTLMEIDADKYLFDRPIAVLTGPSSQSGGDYMPMNMRFHPMSRLFGLTTNGAFGAMEFMENKSSHPISNYPDWIFHRTVATPKLVTNPDEFLNRTNIPPDEEIWLAREEILNGEDKVVKRAIEWIQNLAYAHDVKTNLTYTQPQSDSITITAIVENPNNHPFSVLAYIWKDSAVIDSIYLSKDGAAGDSIWSENWLPIEDEVFYHITIKTDDAVDSTSHIISNVAHFTTAGPLVIDTFVTTQLNDSLVAIDDLTLQNLGAQIAVGPITATLKSISPNVKEILKPKTIYGIIEPGMSKTAFTTCGAIVSDSATIIKLELEISSGGYSYWKDTLTFEYPLVGIKEVVNLPLEFTISQNYPNPFNPSTTLKYEIPKESYITLKVYDILGREVAILVNEQQKAGYYEVNWNAVNNSSGVYFYKIQAGDFVETKKMLLLR